MRNKYAGVCYLCTQMVKAGVGHFERYQGGWRVKHANYPGHGRVTCQMVASELKLEEFSRGQNAGISTGAGSARQDAQ